MPLFFLPTIQALLWRLLRPERRGLHERAEPGRELDRRHEHHHRGLPGQLPSGHDRRGGALKAYMYLTYTYKTVCILISGSDALPDQKVN